MRKLTFISASVFALALGSFAPAQQRPTRPSESVGVSSSRLARVRDVLEEHVAKKLVAGEVGLVLRKGSVVFAEAVGAADVEDRKSMRTDTLFRIASMTKPITTVAVMMLYEEGRFLLTDPVSRYLPEFTDIKVGKIDASNRLISVQAERSITIRDLLTHRSGITYGFNTTGPIGDAYRESGIADGLTPMSGTTQDNVARLAKMPLMHQPGSAYRYGLSIDVLGRLVEVVSGMPLDRFFQERIFKPLTMADTFFYVLDEKVDRLATVYTPETNGIRRMKDPERFGNTFMSPTMAYKGPQTYFSGGAGLVSTASDYARFLQMLLNRGELDGARLLSPKTIELMTTSHTGDLPRGAVGPGVDFGLGFSVVTDLGATSKIGSVGVFGWGGIYGTSFWVDPREQLIGILMIQLYPQTGITLADKFRVAVYQALVN